MGAGLAGDVGGAGTIAESGTLEGSGSSTNLGFSFQSTLPYASARLCLNPTKTRGSFQLPSAQC